MRWSLRAASEGSLGAEADSSVPRARGMALLLAFLLTPACGSSEDDASPPPRPVKERSVHERPGDERPPVAPAPDAEVATVRSYLREKLRDETFASGLGVESFDNAMVSLYAAAEKDVLLRAVRERAADDPALKGVDLARARIASVYLGDGGAPWLLVILDPETGRPLTVVRMN